MVTPEANRSKGYLPRIGRGCQDPDDARMGGFGGRLDRRLHADEGNGWKCASQVLQGSGRGGITSHHDKFRPMPEQESGDLLGKPLHLFHLSRTIGHMPLIGKIHYRFGWQLEQDLT